MGPPLPRRFTLAVVWLALFADYVLMCGALPLSCCPPPLPASSAAL